MMEGSIQPNVSYSSQSYTTYKLTDKLYNNHNNILNLEEVYIF